MRRSTANGRAGRSAPRRRRLRASAGRTAVSALAALVSASIAAGIVLAAPGPVADGVGAPPVAPLSDAPCDEVVDLLPVTGGLDRTADSVTGGVTACVDRDRDRVVLRNDSPVVWVVAEPVTPQGAVREARGATGLVTSAWYRWGRGVAVPPGSTALLARSDVDPVAAPDAEATLLYLSVAAVVAAQDTARAGALAYRPPRTAVSAAALTCGIAAAGLIDRARGDLPDGRELAAAVARAGDGVGCSVAWLRAGLVAQGDGWSLPPLDEAFATPPSGDALLRARAWFAAAPSIGVRG